jgi:hypothetical protein
VTVAVKIIEHSGDSPGSASSSGKRINIGDESLLLLSHPNIVSKLACCTAAPVGSVSSKGFCRGVSQCHC